MFFLNILFAGALLLGDANCDGKESISDAQFISLYDAGLTTGEQANCPDLGDQVLVWGEGFEFRLWGDWNEDGSVDILDALSTAQRVAGLLPPLDTVIVFWGD